tara:strand:- start:28 stop:633 length:606 start_codon:yes stop_codon:yes gene_type:complete
LGTRENIIRVALDNFLVFGVRAVTMDEIAKLAGISKKTIYEEFSSKEELVNATVDETIMEYKCDIEEMQRTDVSAIDHLLLMTKYLREKFTRMNPLLLHDIQRFYPKCWNKISEFKTSKVLQNLTMVLEQGKASGDFRREIDSELLAYMRMDQITNAFVLQKSKSNFSLLECQLAVLDHFIHGILTDQGRSNYYKKLLSSD